MGYGSRVNVLLLGFTAVFIAVSPVSTVPKNENVPTPIRKNIPTLLKRQWYHLRAEFVFSSVNGQRIFVDRIVANLMKFVSTDSTVLVFK